MYKKILLSLFCLCGSLFGTQHEELLTTLIDAIEHDDLEVVVHCIAKDRSCVTACDPYGNTPLHFAAVLWANRRRDHSEDIVLALLKAGARLTAKNDFGKQPTDWIEVIVSLKNQKSSS